MLYHAGTSPNVSGADSRLNRGEERVQVQRDLRNAKRRQFHALAARVDDGSATPRKDDQPLFTDIENPCLKQTGALGEGPFALNVETPAALGHFDREQHLVDARLVQ